MQLLIQQFQSDLESGFAHLPSSLAADAHLAALKRIVTRARGRLRLRHRLIHDGLAICRAQAALVDALIEHLLETATPGVPPAFAIVALGGYGRSELCPCSDIDLMFLHGRHPAAHVTDVASRILYTLWDLGFTVGHSVRSVADCVALAKKDLHIRTALLEARLLTGDASLFDSLMERLRKECFAIKRPEFIRALLAEQTQRRERFGVAVCLLEPHIKEGAGGLRDLHTVLWSIGADARAAGEDPLDRLTAQAPAAVQAYTDMLTIRNELHFLVKRRTDVLTLDLQPKIAGHLHYRDSRTLLASESLMRDYYRAARVLMDFNQRHCAALLESTSRRAWLTPSSRKLDTFQIKHDTLTLNGKVEVFEHDPLAMMRAFDYAQAASLDLAPPLQAALQQSLPRVGAALRSDPQAAEVFKTILRRRGRVGATLRRMHDVGFLGKYLPAFGRITFLVQHDLYHRYTIDEHTLRALEALDVLAISDNPRLGPFRQVFESIADAGVLYLGLLLHDIGKGQGGGHIPKGMGIARRVGRQLHFDAREVDEVVFLIEHHLLMSQVSQRRDIDDEDEVRAFAARVGTVERLKMLLLLTYADLSAVGPDVFNDWKAALLLRLYTNVRLFLERGHRQPSASALTAAVLTHAPTAARRALFARHVALMPSRYLTGNDPARIAEHALAASRTAKEPVVAIWSDTHDSGMTGLTVCTADRHGLFALISGVLAAHGVNILGAQINTRKDGVAIDTFQVCEPDGNPLFDPKRRDRVIHDLDVVITGRKPLARLFEDARPRSTPRRLKKPALPGQSRVEVRFDNDSSPTATIIEVRTTDRLGLVYRLSSALSDAGLDISFARIATIKHDILDVFYVTDRTGEKLTDAVFPGLRERIEERISDE